MLIQSFLNNQILPRLVYLPWIITWIWLTILTSLHFLKRKLNQNDQTQEVRCLAIEAGERGWQSIEFKEMFQSACEYLGPEHVTRFVVKNNTSYLSQLSFFLHNNQISHYVYDPRSGSQQWFLGLWQSFRTATLLQQYNVVPVILLTDLSMRRWRTQAAMVSARKGLVVSFMSSRIVSPIFPHSRLLGPSLMPLSVLRRNMLDEMIRSRPENKPPQAIFIGSLYEPRTSILNEIESHVKAMNGEFKCLGREIGSVRITDEEYWTHLVNADIVFTTSLQMTQSGTDWTHVPHLIYRYIEVLAAGSLLIAQDVPGASRYFIPGIHYVSYNSTKNAAEKIINLLQETSIRKSIAQEGKKKADSLIESRVFWMTIDACLTINGLK